MSISVHDRPRLDQILSPGRKTRIFHAQVSQEVARLAQREEQLEKLIATSGSYFAVMLATEQLERLVAKRDLMLTRRAPGRRGRPIRDLAHG